MIHPEWILSFFSFLKPVLTVWRSVNCSRRIQYAGSSREQALRKRSTFFSFPRHNQKDHSALSRMDLRGKSMVKFEIRINSN